MKRIVTGVFALIIGLQALAVPKKDDLEAILRALRPIENDIQLNLGKTCNVQVNTVEILEKLCALSPEIVSLNDILLSAIEHLDINFTGTLMVDNIPVIEAISLLGETLCSKIETLSQQTSLNDALLLTAIDGITGCDLTPVESQLDVIESKIDALHFSLSDGCCSTINEINSKLDTLTHVTSINDALILTAIDGIAGCDLTPVESQLDVIESKIDAFNVSLSDGCCSVINEISSKIDSLTNLISINDALILTAIDTFIACDLTPVESQLDVIESKIDAIIFSTLDNLCLPISISTPQTISTSGSYILCNNISGTITIAASDVVLDLNNYKISDGIVVNGGLDQITMRNGVVEGTTNGILVNGGSRNITIENITVKNASLGSGIKFTNVTDATIDGCTLTSNSTGLQFNNSHKISVNNTVANCNSHAGFDLISSTTNTFIDCKALSTGQGNTVQFNNEVAGFVSLNGYGNIFERCIANGTQALATIDSNSLIAGFALRGNEGCSKIIECEAANSTSSPNGYTIPYGILLEGSMSSITSITGALGTAGIVNSVNWSPDGQYVAVGGSGLTGGSELSIFSFNRSSGLQTLVASALHSGTVHSVNWSPDGQYLAVGGENLIGNQLQIFSFNRANGVLVAVSSTFSSGAVASANWSSDGQYLAVVGDALGDNNSLYIFSFERSSESLSFIAKAIIEVLATIMASVNWSPDGQFIAVGSTDLGMIGGAPFWIFEFDKSSGILTVIVNQILTSIAGSINSVNWSPDGQYVVIGGNGLTGNNELRIYRFDRVSGTIIFAASALGVSGNVRSVNWSPDGQYIAVGGSSLTGNECRILRFNRPSSLITSATLLAGNVYSVNWSPDGQYLAIGGDAISGGTDNEFQILTGLQFPNHNVITNNTVYCNSGGIYPSGVGISGPSICNMIIGNTAYSNPIPSSINHPIVSSNYYFVCNVFNQLFGQTPSALQNISLGGCEVISQPTDLGLLASQILYKVCVPIPSQLDVVESKIMAIDSQIDVVESKIDKLICPAPTPISTAQTISTSGSYILCNNITGTITIAASNVALDLNNYKISNGIVVNGGLDQITMRNGVVEGTTNGILVNGGSRNITIENITVKNASLGSGIKFTNVTDATIDGCTLTSNSTGLQLNNSHKISVNNTVANCNSHAGFDLISSTTNTFIDCKALSTGQGNTVQFNNEVAGFVSLNGYGNIFERCIANSTQALSTTDSNSLIAGFALRGNEGCSKIIECEAANSTSSPNGYTIPYGILLEGTISSISSCSTQCARNRRKRT
jgi:FOG: WD40 repeat